MTYFWENLSATATPEIEFTEIVLKSVVRPITEFWKEKTLCTFFVNWFDGLIWKCFNLVATVSILEFC